MHPLSSSESWSETHSEVRTNPDPSLVMQTIYEGVLQGRVSLPDAKRELQKVGKDIYCICEEGSRDRRAVTRLGHSLPYATTERTKRCLPGCLYWNRCLHLAAARFVQAFQTNEELVNILGRLGLQPSDLTLIEELTHRICCVSLARRIFLRTACCIGELDLDSYRRFTRQVTTCPEHTHPWLGVDTSYLEECPFPRGGSQSSMDLPLHRPTTADANGYSHVVDGISPPSPACGCVDVLWSHVNHGPLPMPNYIIQVLSRFRFNGLILLSDCALLPLCKKNVGHRQ